jgi:hypothetical protein
LTGHSNASTSYPIIEAIVYFLASPDGGPQHRIYDDEDIPALGGVHAIERLLERESYWFIRLGEARGQLSPAGVCYGLDTFARLPKPAADRWRLGRRNPAFRGSELERYVFEAIFKAIERMLAGWKCERDGLVLAYALKEVKICSDRLLMLTRSLSSLQKVHEITRITTIKYWYDPSWPEPNLPGGEFTLAEYSIRIPFQVQWSGDENLVHAEVMTIGSC